MTYVLYDTVTQKYITDRHSVVMLYEDREGEGEKVLGEELAKLAAQFINARLHDSAPRIEARPYVS